MQSMEQAFYLEASRETAREHGSGLQNDAWSAMALIGNGRLETAHKGLPALEITGLEDTKGNCKDYLDKFAKGQDLDPAEKTAKNELDVLTKGPAGKAVKQDIEKWSAKVGPKDIESQGLSGMGDDDLLAELKKECAKGPALAGGLRIATILEAMRASR